MKDYLLTVELIIYQYVHVVFWLSYINRHINTFSINLYGYRVTVILVFKEQYEFLRNGAKLIRDKGKDYLC